MFKGATLPGKKRLDGILPAVTNAVGLGEQAYTPFSFPQAKRACVVLADGLGYQQLVQRLGHAPNIRRLGLGNPVTTIVPSTTAAGITAFGTGQRPGMTAMAGYSLRVPGTSRVFSLISWNDSQVRAETWQTQPTVFENLGPDAAQVRLIQPAKFINSGLTNAGLRGAQVVAAEKLAQRVDATLNQFRKGAKLVYLYWGDLDSTGHTYGWQSERWIGELEHFDAEFGRLIRSLPRDTLLVFTADHGMIDVDERVDIAHIPQLRDGVEVVAGEPRAVHLYTSEPEEVAQRWREYCGDQAWVATKREVIDVGLLGPVSDFTQSVIGDVAVFARDNRVYVDSRVQSAQAISLVGVHGSLTAQEMQIPLIVEVL
ncbi:MAG: alkaline phosphatase family protein [Arcanobacterium sp.]